MMKAILVKNPDLNSGIYKKMVEYNKRDYNTPDVSKMKVTKIRVKDKDQIEK
jgi:hypothetical protein